MTQETTRLEVLRIAYNLTMNQYEYSNSDILNTAQFLMSFIEDVSLNKCSDSINNSNKSLSNLITKLEILNKKD